jgi:hypothetical protein
MNTASNGRAVTLTPMTNAGGSQIPISPNMGGWTQAGNMGVPPQAQAGSTLLLSTSGDVFIAGTKYPFQAGYVIPKTDIAKAVGTLGCSLISGGLATLACMAAVPYVADWITKAGGRVNPTTGAFERQDMTGITLSDGKEYRATSAYSPAEYFPSRDLACQAFAAAWNGRLAANSNERLVYVSASPTACLGRWVWEPASTTTTSLSPLGSKSSTCAAGNYHRPGGQCSPTPGANWIPSSMDDIAPYMNSAPYDSRVVGEIISKGGDIALPNPTVTGPSTILGPKEETVNADGSRTVKQTTNNFTTNGNTITNTNSVTNTTVYNTDNSVRSTSSTTTTPQSTDPAQEEKDPCKSNPDRFGCQILEKPEGDQIPKSTKTITYAEESQFGGGSCPADVMWSPQSISGSYKFINWQQACGWALQLKWVVLLLAAWAAFWIVMPGNTQVKPQ